MTNSEKINFIRDLMPVTQNKVYLNTGSGWPVINPYGGGVATRQPPGVVRRAGHLGQ